MQIGASSAPSSRRRSNRKFEGAKLLLVQPLTPRTTPRGAALLAIDSVGAGVGEKVLIVLEGRAAGEALGKKLAPVDAAIVGIVDDVDVRGRRIGGRSHHDGRRARNWCATRSLGIWAAPRRIAVHATPPTGPRPSRR